MKTTYKKLLDFNTYAGGFLRQIQEKKRKSKGVDDAPVDITEAETKVEAALKDIADQLEPFIDKYNKSVNKLRRNHALEDPKTMKILRNEQGGYEYSKEGEDDLEAALDELLENERDLDIEPTFVAIPEDFDRFLTRKFKGFIFEDNVESTIKKLNQTVK